MTSSYPHLPLQREAPITEKRPGQPPRPKKLDDPKTHGQSLKLQLQKTIQQTEHDIGGFDDRRLFRFNEDKGFNPNVIKLRTNSLNMI